MKCERHTIGGARVIVCRQRRASCKVCGTREHDVLCDAPLVGPRAGKTCSMKLCRDCAIALGPGVDMCMPHARAHRGRAAAAARVVLGDDGIVGARGYYVNHRHDALALLGLADALRLAGHDAEAAKVTGRLEPALVARMGSPGTNR